MADKYKIAVASSDGIVVNRHFGRADAFYIYEVDEGGGYLLLETRNAAPVCSGGNHDDNELCCNISKLSDCKYVLVSRIGTVAADRAEQAGLIPMELPGTIEESIDRLIAYEKVQNLF